MVLACLIDWFSGGGAGASVFAGALVPSLRVLDLSIVRSTISITSGSVMALCPLYWDVPHHYLRL